MWLVNLKFNIAFLDNQPEIYGIGIVGRSTCTVYAYFTHTSSLHGTFPVCWKWETIDLPPSSQAQGDSLLTVWPVWSRPQGGHAAGELSLPAAAVGETGTRLGTRTEPLYNISVYLDIVVLYSIFCGQIKDSDGVRTGYVWDLALVAKLVMVCATCS